MKKLLQLIRDTGVWAPVAVLVFHEFASVKGYRTQIDWINHFSGGLAFSYFAWKNIPFLVRWMGTPTVPGRLAATFLAGCSAAIWWEIAEFSSDVFLGSRIQRSIHETMVDEINGVLGTITTVGILGVREYRSQRKVA
ncbi:hypothetical protein JIN84_22020 [Luteolibacter yonseiensis]|uniref:Uncharacterized protein n=1 Tax=Luteolibacter yonseiensis TaxID=1144680 RepID=A0A934R4L4_9BACT|nr:hypothetical protein [Luteolibacter yonseiensis]MBK1818313.1 hypothetical protein [Luteolibacter yonseiensis]